MIPNLSDRASKLKERLAKKYGKGEIDDKSKGLSETS